MTGKGLAPGGAGGQAVVLQRYRFGMATVVL